MDVFGLPWWRFSKYQIRDGYVVPARGAGQPSHFDFSDRDSGGARVGARTPAYLELANVPDPYRENEIPAPSAGEARRLLDWSARFGATGVLLHRTAEVVLPQGTLHRWQGGGWFSATTRAKPRSLMRKLDPSHGWEDQLTDEPLTTTWWRFFPHLWAGLHEWDPHVFAAQEPVGREATELLRRDWPEPGSTEFHRTYRESVPDFLAAALALRRAHQWAVDGLAKRLSLEQRSRSFIQINHLQSPASQALVPRSRGVHAAVRWSAPSALAALAIMAASDLAAGHEFEYCERSRCRRMFRVLTPRARYCSRPCLDAEKQRVYRAAKRDREGAIDGKEG